MAWRIHDTVQHGELDNREKGVVRGRLWLHGRAEPVVLELKGNACPDLAGCRLTFENPGKTIPLPSDVRFDPLQRGTVGNLTASNKVRLYTVPKEEALAMMDRGEKPPQRVANALYLEWFSEQNGRVVIESEEYRLDLSPPAWRLSPEEEQQRQRDTEAGWAGFVQKLDQAVDQQRHPPAEDKDWDEFDYEKFMKESDARTDKYMELLEKYGDDANADELIAKEMGWHDDQEERAGTDGGEPAADDDWLDVDEINRITAEAVESPPQPDPLTEGEDWIRTGDGDIRHPLQHRCFESAMKLWHKCDDLGLDKSADPDLTQLITEFQITGAKLAGALNSLAYNRTHRDGAFIVAYLKRGLDHLHKAQAGLEKVAPKQLLPPETLVLTRRELFEIREGILHLMEEFRGRK